MFRKLFRGGTYIAPRPLGKYIIIYSSLMHLVWGILLALDVNAGASTPVQALVVSLWGRWPAVVALFVVSGLALWFVSKRAVKPISSFLYGILLFPQLWLLLLSAGGSIVAIFQQHYSDGTFRPWSHIATDQSAIIILLFLYATAVIEIGRNKINSLHE